METNNEGSDLTGQLQQEAQALATGQQGQLTQTDGQETENNEQQVDVTALQKQLAEVQAEAARYQKQALDHQAAFTQARQQISALTGFKPQVDPVDELAKKIHASGQISRTPEQARVFAELLHEVNAPIQRQLQAQQLAMHNQGQLDHVMQNLYVNAPQVMNDPSAYQSIESNLRAQAMEYAQAGQPWNREAAMEFGKILVSQEYGRKALFGGNGQQQPQQAPMQIRSQWGPAPGFLGQQQATQQKPQDTDAMKQYQAMIDKQFNLPNKK